MFSSGMFQRTFVKTVKMQLLGLLSAVLFSFSLFGQTAAITGSIATVTGSQLVNPGLQVQLLNCSGAKVPTANGTAISASIPAFFGGANPTGLVYGNDIIQCGTQNNTLYAVTWFNNNQPASPTAIYRLTEGTTCNITNNTCVPVAFSPPTVQNTAGQICPAGQVLQGFNKNYVPVCNTFTSTPLSLSSITAALGYAPTGLKDMPFFSAKNWGALIDGVHDDTATLNALALAARAANQKVYLNGGTYRVTNSIDFRGNDVTGAGMYITALLMDRSVQRDVVLISQNTNISDFGIIGNWDGGANEQGVNINGTSTDPSSSQLPYHMSLRNIYTQGSKSYNILLTDPAYTKLYNIDAHGTGGNAILYLQSHLSSTGFQPTTVAIENSTFSDALNVGNTAYAIRVEQGVGISIRHNQMENTQGIQFYGPGFRNAEVVNNYEEDGGSYPGAAHKFLTFTGTDGIGLEFSNNFGVQQSTLTCTDLATWIQFHTGGNDLAGQKDCGSDGANEIIRGYNAGVMDPVSILKGEYDFSSGIGNATVVGQAPQNAGSWQITFVGNWTDSSSHTMSPETTVFVGSGTTPTSVKLNNTALSCQLNTGGQPICYVSFQFGGSSLPLRFVGTIRVVSDRQTGAFSDTFQTQGQIRANSFSTTPNGGAAVTGIGSTCTSNGWVQLVIDNTPRKVAICQ